MKITVDRPCRESWENMLPDQQGKYCLCCQKSVVDFTGWSDAQLVAFSAIDRGTSAEDLPATNWIMRSGRKGSLQVG